MKVDCTDYDPDNWEESRQITGVTKTCPTGNYMEFELEE